MIHDIKIFDGHGNLKEVINGKKYFDKLYEETTKSFIVERKKTKETFTCRFCKQSFPRISPKQFCCRQAKCRYQHSLIRRPLKGGRKITCRICNKETTVTHSGAVTCGPECSAENNRRINLVNGLACRKKNRTLKKRKEMTCQK
tara:strand:- start:2921 stop:3352 length:432 start_codon:yes stop_codon:yes gene_type:complete